MRVVLIVCMVLLGVIFTKAQEKYTSIDFNFGTGIQKLKYDLLSGTKDYQPGYNLNFDYNYFFSKKWGVGLGVGLKSLDSKSKLNFETVNPSIDSEGESFDFHTKYTNWQERLSVFMLDIPIRIIYQKEFTEKIKIRISMGPKVSFPVQSHYETTGGSITTTGYYPQYNVFLSDMPQHNFGTILNFPRDEIHFKPSVVACSDVGGLYKLNKRLDLYVGNYLDCGISNMINAHDKLLMQEDGVYNGIFDSNLTSKVKQFSLGFKIGLSLNLGVHDYRIKEYNNVLEDVR